MNNQAYTTGVGIKPLQQGLQNAGQPAQPERKKYYVKVDPLDFNGTFKSKLITTFKIGEIINRLFKSVLSDYEGCIIVPNNFGQFEVVMYFRDKGAAPDNKVKAIMSASSKTNKQNSALERIQQMNIRNSAKKYELTQEAKDVIEEFIPTKPGQSPKWSEHVFEQNEVNYNVQTVYVRVNGLDLLRVLGKLYGRKSGDSRIEYAVSPVRVVGADVNGQLKNWLISVQQLDSTKVEELANELGMIPTTGQIQMIR